MKLNCIIKNTKILQKLEVLVGNIANNMIAKDIVPTPTNIYNQVRNLGVEIDLSTIGAIYAKNLSNTDTSFLSVTEVEQEIGADFNNTVKKMIQLDKGTKEIGKRSPAEAVANAIASIFVDRNAPPQMKTLLREMQDIMLKGLKRHIPQGNPLKNSVSPFDVAREAVSKLDTLGVTDINGQLNTLEGVFDDVKEILKQQVSELKAKGADAATIAKYEDMIDNVVNSTYQLLFSKTEAKQVIVEAIKNYKNGIFTKTDSKGKVKLDYDALSGHIKSEQDLRQNVEDALQQEGFSKRDIDIITDSLAQEFKDAYANILQKAVNKLNQKQNAKDKVVISKSDLDRLAQLHALNAFGSAHEKMIYELLGLNPNTVVDIAKVEKIAAELNRMKDASFPEKSYREKLLMVEINKIIAEARFRDATWGFKIAKTISNLVGMTNLAILNNIKNRIDNNVSGKMERFYDFAGKGFEGLPPEIVDLAKAGYEEYVKNGGQSVGELDMFFQGDVAATERLREKFAKWVNEGDTLTTAEKWTNWTYNQIMGTAALNGLDSLNKTKLAWSKFITNMEQVLLDKGIAKTRNEATKMLHEQLFGDKWKEAEQKARDLINVIEKDGSILRKATDQQVKILAADIVKFELVNNGLISKEELEATWDASYKAAGRGLGHVANNVLSKKMQMYATESQQNIRTALEKGEYKKAAMLTWVDLILNKVILKFAGGGTNWIVLNVEKSGLGLIPAIAKKTLFLEKRKNISNMKVDEIEENLYEHMKTNDKLVRSLAGLTLNSLLFMLAYTAFGGDDDEDKKRKKQMIDWAEKNQWANKYMNILPLYLTGYLAYMRQSETKEGLAGTFNKYKYSPLRNFVENFTNKNDTYSFDNQIQTALSKINSQSKKGKELKQEAGWETVGQLLGNYFSVDPLPYRPIKDMKDVYEGVFGKETKSDRDKADTKAKKGDGEVNVKDAMLKGYRKFGVTDW